MEQWGRKLGCWALCFGMLGCTPEASLLSCYQARRHCDYGTSYLYLGKLRSAEDEFQRAKELNPQEAKAYEGLGEVFLKERKYAAAKEELQQAVTLDPGLASAYLKLSEAYLRVGEWEQVKQLAQEAVNLPRLPNPARPHYYLGRAHLGNGRYRQAELEFTKALGLTPEAIEIRYWLGFGLACQGKSAQAQTEYRIALAQLNQRLSASSALDNDQKELLGNLHWNLGRLYQEKGYQRQALFEFREAKKYNPSLTSKQVPEAYATGK